MVLDLMNEVIYIDLDRDYSLMFSSSLLVCGFLRYILLSLFLS